MEPEKITVDLEVPIFIFWHIYICENRLLRGTNIINRQFEKLKNSGLLDRCDTIYIGYVSTLDFPCENIINHPKVKIIVQKDSGYEGVTTTSLKDFCDNEKKESLIMYIHNRGISRDEDSPIDDWTFMMEHFIIEKWRSSITMLETKYTCGCELWAHQGRGDHNESIYHYSGNFWWSRSSYIKLLQHPSCVNRFAESEDWVLQLAEHGIAKENFGILHRTSANRYERGMVHSYIDRYPFDYYKSGNETPDIEIDRNLFHGEHCHNNIH
jgi:hypothetical protein